MTPEQCASLFERLARSYPHPATELEYRNPFQLLLAVILSAQATDVGVNAVTRSLFRSVQTPADVLCMGEESFTAAIRSIGLYRSKARHVLAACAQLERLHGGIVPGERAALEALPGVGRKTANVVLNVAFGKPTVAVDTHVFRVSNRTGLAPGKTVVAVERLLLERIPPAYLIHAHHWLIAHGRRVCRARRPLCAGCELADLCQWHHLESHVSAYS